MSIIEDNFPGAVFPGILAYKIAPYLVTVHPILLHTIRPIGLQMHAYLHKLKP